MTGNENRPDDRDNPYYIPPTAGPGSQAYNPPAKKPGANDWLGLVYMIVALFVLIAAFQLYFVIQDLIRTWISDQFVPFFSACYYLAVIIVGVWLIREYVRKQ